MFNWLSYLLDSAIQIMESRGIRIVIPIIGVNLFISVFFLDIKSFSTIADLIKNIILSLIAIAMAVMGAVNTYISMRKNIREHKKVDNKKPVQRDSN